MDFEQKMELCSQWLSEDYKIDKQTAHKIISDLDIYNRVVEYYQDWLNEKEKEYLEQQKAEAEYNREHYADGWSDHEGV